MYTHASESSAEYVVLHGSQTTVVLETRTNEAPLWRYWGPKLPSGCLPVAPLRDGRPIPPSTMEFDQPLTVVPTFGVGWYGQSALLAHRSGRQFAQNFDNCRTEVIDAGRSVVLHLSDSIAEIGLELSLSLDTHDMLRLQSRLVNLGSDVLDVQWLAAGCVPLPGNAHQVRSYFGQWANEFQLQIDDLSGIFFLSLNRRFWS